MIVIFILGALCGAIAIWVLDEYLFVRPADKEKAR